MICTEIKTLLPSLWRSSMLKTCWQFELFWVFGPCCPFWFLCRSGFLRISDFTVHWDPQALLDEVQMVLTDAQTWTVYVELQVVVFFFAGVLLDVGLSSDIYPDQSVRVSAAVGLPLMMSPSSPYHHLSERLWSSSQTHRLHDEAWWSTHFQSRCWGKMFLHTKVATDFLGHLIL